MLFLLIPAGAINRMRNSFRHVHLHGGEGLIEGLKNRGYKPEDITDVFLTHLHADHCGGGVKRNSTGTGYELTFPEATYHVSRAQWEWAVKNNLTGSRCIPRRKYFADRT